MSIPRKMARRTTRRTKRTRRRTDKKAAKRQATEEEERRGRRRGGRRGRRSGGESKSKGKKKKKEVKKEEEEAPGGPPDSAGPGGGEGQVREPQEAAQEGPDLPFSEMKEKENRPQQAARRAPGARRRSSPTSTTTRTSRSSSTSPPTPTDRRRAARPTPRRGFVHIAAAEGDASSLAVVTDMPASRRRRCQRHVGRPGDACPFLFSNPLSLHGLALRDIRALASVPLANSVPSRNPSSPTLATPCFSS
ncbi:unnamed protein product [Prorocentrum cordatum]|uniref:Uncharacterized protein n=1 Tax=Prorocentrum cordatum TaxID=2364126 RepID=A0ABN9VZ05_9DINO|nr:unnamed protein product [Polarella glacialis]